MPVTPSATSFDPMVYLIGWALQGSVSGTGVIQKKLLGAVLNIPLPASCCLF